MSRRTLRRVLEVTACLVAIGLVAGLLRPNPASSELERAVAAAEFRMAARMQREAAWGETHDGSAFASHVAAVDSMPMRMPVCWDPESREWVTGSGERLVLSRQEVDGLRTEWQTSLQHLVEGAHRRDATPRRFRDGARLENWHVAAEIQLRLQEGRLHEAVQLWLDGFTFRLDCRVWLDLPPFADWSDGDLQRLGPAPSGALAAGLTRLESRLLVPPDAGGTFVWFARPLLDGDYSTGDWSWSEIGGAWRWGFDPAARHVAAFEELYRAAAALEGAGSRMTGREREEWWQRLHLPDWAERSFLVSSARQRACAEVRSWCRLLTELRLLRLALAFHLRQPVTDLIDPFSGAPLYAAIDGDTAVFRGSIGDIPPERRATRR